MEQVRVNYVKVTNKADVPFTDMYDGIPVVIDAGGSQTIRPEQAFHFFGYVEGAGRQQLLLHTAKRQGWNTAPFQARDDSGKTLMERKFDELVIEPVTFKLVEERVSDTDAPILAEAAGGAAHDAPPETAPPPPKVPPKPQTAKAPTRPPQRHLPPRRPHDD